MQQILLMLARLGAMISILERGQSYEPLVRLCGSSP